VVPNVVLGVALAMLLFVAAAGSAQERDPDRTLKPAEPDFALVALPTSLNVPVHGSAFRVTHRFTRPLNCDGCANSLAGDAFGLDGGAQIGLEYRYGIAKNLQAGVHRASDKTYDVFGQYGLTRQSETMPVETAVRIGLDVTNVGRKSTPSEYSPTVGVIAGRMVGTQAALYVEPMLVHHANVFLLPGDDSVFMVGLGARVRVRRTVYVTGEYTPRVAGFKAGVNQGSIAIEKRAGGHMFQLNFSNGLGTTMGQVARGGPTGNNWYMGFNLSRKFF
jgi:hypothetical protein